MKRLCVMGFVCAVGVVAMGQELKEETSISLGLNATDGNSETLSISLGLNSSCEWEGTGTLDLNIEGNYGKQRVGDVKEKTVDNVQGSINGKRLISDRSFWYGEASSRYDDIALIDYRLTIGPGLGTHLVMKEDIRLLVELGPSYIFEMVDDVRDDYAALRVAQEYRQTLSESSKVWQTAQFLPRLEEMDVYFLDVEVGIESAINSRMNLRLVVQNKYDSDPPEGVEKNDLSIIAGFGLRL